MSANSNTNNNHFQIPCCREIQRFLPSCLLDHMRCQPLPFLLLPGALCFLTFLSNLCAVVVGTAVNRSIDDTLGDSVTGQRPLFLPATSGVWEDETCAGK
ncbi:hypothetical protein GGU10DRAFT_353974 [Lentinula aff. detonsa]|uniref:Uncharacterized protein n=1 Tax=Lentinula aff. detonsa TaxID=2804958 RepID=A0AA38L5Q0_9AGAR|nr:hypothetical protein GGU10DRAFT_353974 [Lentinula aff. detonsa]